MQPQGNEMYNIATSLQTQHIYLQGFPTLIFTRQQLNSMKDKSKTFLCNLTTKTTHENLPKSLKSLQLNNNWRKRKGSFPSHLNVST